MTWADRPASALRVVHGGSQLPAFSFDPIMEEAIRACGQEWTNMFLVPGTSWADIYDNKVPNCSRKWKEYGMRTVPTKDKKLKPVFHVMATVGTGFICWFALDKLGMRLGDMMRN